MRKSGTQMCHNCECQIDSNFYSQHIRQCEQPQKQQSVYQKQNQKQNTPQGSNGIQTQKNEERRTDNHRPQKNGLQKQEEEMQYHKCEYCDEKYPDIMFNEHVELCDARLQLLKFQEEEQAPRATQQHNQFSQNNSRRNHDQQDLNNLQPGQCFRSETILPNGSVKIVMASRDGQGNLNVQQIVNGNGNGHSNRNSGISTIQQRGNQNQMNQMRQIMMMVPGNGVSSNNNTVMIMRNGGQEGQQLFSVSGQYFNLVSQGQQAEQGLQEEDRQAQNSVKFKKSATLSEENKKCVICMTDYEERDELMLLRCTHRFHNKCIDQWLKNHINCPICKKNVMN